jgi:predicted DCC family thiol-disulfide oxidoreductase YuxK
MNNPYPLTLLYEANCPVCALEMDHLRSLSHDGRLLFVDICQPGFEPAAYGASLADMEAEIHALCADGSLLRGMPVLRLAYDAAGLGWVMRPTGWGPLRPGFDLCYRWFARHRHRISSLIGPLIRGVRAFRARQMAARMRECHNGACDIERR